MRAILFAAILFMAAPGVLADGPRWTRASAADRARTNPYASQADALSAGRLLFSDHCSKCHGEDALGRGKRPSLRSPEVQGATDGELFWLLTNGSLRKGMPSWSALPEASRWQLVTFLKSLGVDNGANSSGESPKETTR